MTCHSLVYLCLHHHTKVSSCQLLVLSMCCALSWVRSHILTHCYLLSAWSFLAVWHGMISVRQSFFKGAILKFIIQFPQSYPEGPPEITFASSVDCKRISSEGRLDLGLSFEPWNREALCQRERTPMLAVLRYIKQTFYLQPSIDASAAIKVHHCATESHMLLPEISSEFLNSRIRFENFDWEVHGHAVRTMGCESLPAARVIQKYALRWRCRMGKAGFR